MFSDQRDKGKSIISIGSRLCLSNPRDLHHSLLPAVPDRNYENTSNFKLLHHNFRNNWCSSRYYDLIEGCKLL